MSAIQRTLTAARTRLFYQQCLRNLGWALLAALAVAIALVATERLLGRGLPVWTYAPVALLAVVSAVVAAGLRFPSTAHAAAQIDVRLKLKDRLATSLYVQSKPTDPFTSLVLSDAEQAANHLALASAFPIRLTRVWGYVVPAALVTLGLWLWLPNDLLGRQQALARQARIAERQAASAAAAQERIVKVVEAIRQPKDGQKPTELDPEMAKALRDLVEMSQRELTDPQAARTAAGKLAAARELVKAKADEKEQDLRPLQSELSRLDVKHPGPADKLADALQRGDFAAAQAEWDQLAQGLEDAPPGQQAALGQQLSQIASQLSGAQNPANNSSTTQPSMANGQPQSPTTQPLSLAANPPGAPGASGAQTQPAQASGPTPATTQPTSLAKLPQPPGTQPSRFSSNQAPQGPANNMAANNAQRPGQNLAQCLNRAGQCAACSSTQPSTSSQTQQAAGQVSQQLGQLAQAQRDAQALRECQGQLQQALRSLPGLGQQPGGMQPGGLQPGDGGMQPGSSGMQAHGGQGGPDQQSGMMAGMIPNPSGPGGKLGGTGRANQLFGKEQPPTAAQTELHKEIDESAGRMIASWQTDGPMAKGAPTVEFDKAVDKARDDVAKAVAEDRLPHRYRDATLKYFGKDFAPAPTPAAAPALPPGDAPAPAPQPTAP